jgi:D-ribose pyranase
MKRDGILNEDILRVLGSLGHTDRIVVCDAGLPIDLFVEKIDLAVVKGIVRFEDVLVPLLQEAVFEKAIVAKEIVAKSPEMFRHIKGWIGGMPLEKVSHEEFKKLCKNVKAIIRTGECTPYANIILQSGVNFS